MASYNAYLTYGGNRFPLYVTSFSYPLQMMDRGSAQAKRHHTIYPYRAMRGDVAVKARFRNRTEYQKFGMFIEQYHYNVVQQGGGMMRFESPRMIHNNSGRHTYGISPSKDISWAVTIEKLNMVVSYDMSPAPEVAFTMRILDDEYTDVVTSGSGTTGGVVDLVEDPVVYSSDIASYGDSSFHLFTKTAISAVVDPFGTPQQGCG